MKLHYELLEGADGWRVRLRADNGEIIATTEAYDSKGNAQHAMDRLATATLAQSNSTGRGEGHEAQG
jgi:uncharacterized protein YegP (UPF0339 family)